MYTHPLCRLGLLLVVLAAGLLGGCSSDPKNIDPWEKSNRFFYDFDNALDKVALKPLSDGYVKFVPQPVRTCIGNGFDNMGYVNVIVNDFMQGQWNQGWSDVGRMAVNTTVGVVGLFDVAAHWNMPSHDNDFGITLAQWGVEPGPYMVLPLFGPQSLRDVPGIGVGMLTDPILWIDPPLYVVIPYYTLQAVDARSRAERYFKFRNAAAVDSYVFTRSAYLQYREAQIHPERRPNNESLYEDEEGSATRPATAPATAPASQSARPAR